MWFVYSVAYIVVTIVLIGFSVANGGQTVPEIILWDWGRRLVVTNAPLAVAMLVAFFAGAFLASFATLGREIGLRRRLRRTERERRRLDAELAAIRHLPFDEPLAGLEYRDPGYRDRGA